MVRLGSVNAEGEFSPNRTVRKQDVDSLFIQRSKKDAAKLCMRLKDDPRRVTLMVGPEDELVSPLKRVFETLFADKSDKRRAMTKIHASTIEAHLA